MDQITPPPKCRVPQASLVFTKMPGRNLGCQTLRPWVRGVSRRACAGLLNSRWASAQRGDRAAPWAPGDSAPQRPLSLNHQDPDILLSLSSIRSSFQE